MEIYDTPQSTIGNDNDTKSGVGKSIIASVLGIIASLIYIALYKAIPQFEETFTSFGADLPWFTSFVTKIDHLFWVPSLFSLLIFTIWLVRIIKPEKVAPLLIVSILNVSAAFICIPLCMVAMYLPIFQLGAVL